MPTLSHFAPPRGPERELGAPPPVLRPPASVLRPLSSVLRPPSPVLRLLLLLCLAAAPLARAQQQPAPQISEAVAAEFGQLRTLTEAKDYAPALALIDRTLPNTAPDSYDRILLSQVKVQILLTQGDYTAAIAPLEEVLRLADRPGYLAPAVHTESLYLLSQLYQQRSAELKDPAGRAAALDRALAALRLWQARLPRPTPDAQLFAATLLYQKATLDPDRIDAALLEDARRAALTGLSLQATPPNSLYVLLLAIHQQRGEIADAAELLELLVARNPANASYWQQLVSAYLNLAAAASPDERASARQNLRALLTLERAQALGHLSASRDHFNLVALHLGLRQFAPAIALLEKRLADGTLENTRRNWELLVNACQQAGRPADALAAAGNAVRALPADGQLEFTLAQLHYTDGRLADTRLHLERALDKGALDKPGQTRLFLAYVAYELKDYAAADTHVRAAAALSDARPEDVARLTQAIAEARAKS